MTVQRFIYWNFLKCFWSDRLGRHNSILTNYDWYAPSQAFRFSEDEFRAMVETAGLETVFSHTERACLSGRFVTPAADPS